MSKRAQILYEEIAKDPEFGRVLEYQKQLEKWNQRFPLTSVPAEEVMARLIAPSVWLAMRYRHQDVGLICDFGSGAGIPGIPMAIIDSRNKYVMIESNSKKAGFLRSCMGSLSINKGSNIDVLQERIKPGAWDNTEKVNAVVTRGTGTILEIVDMWTGKLSPGARFDIFKGERAGLEITELHAKYPDAQARHLGVPDWFGNLQVVRIEGVI